MISPGQIIAQLDGGHGQQDVYVTLSELRRLLPNESPVDLVIGLCELEGVQITNSYEGGIMIPGKYFNKK